MERICASARAGGPALRNRAGEGSFLEEYEENRLRAGILAHNDHGGSLVLRKPMDAMIGEQKAKCQALEKRGRIQAADWSGNQESIDCASEGFREYRWGSGKRRLPKCRTHLAR